VGKFFPTDCPREEHISPQLRVDSDRGAFHNDAMNFGILVVDDEIEVCRSLKEILNSKGYQARFETDPRKVMENIRETRTDLVLMDLRMPEIGGIDLLKSLRSAYPDLAVIIISGYATVDTAVRAMKYGALNLFTKPIKISLLRGEIEKIRESLDRKHAVKSDEILVSQDPKMRQVLSLVEMAAPTDASVLITGESGTGKELIANTLHARSGRREKPFIKVNCASIPETLLESEMFGHERGAFTDAKDQKKGLFELACGGSIFLDEIGDMNLGIQAKMLRVLQDKKFVRLGGSKFIEADCRIIAATNHDLRSAIKEGRFREDLYYRLAVINLHVPPLRERKMDILPLAEYFLDSFSRTYAKSISGMSEEVLRIVIRHTWPGNIRELRNFMERAVIFTQGGTVELSSVPEQYLEITEQATQPDLEDRFDGAAREVITEALSLSHGIKREAAKLLRIDRKTLYNRMKKLNMS